MYNLITNGITDLARFTSLLSQRKISGDGLSGVTDGINNTFYTSFSPVLASGSLTCYNASGSVIAVTSVDYDSGEVVLPNAPTFQPKASYTLTPFTSTQQIQMLFDGFDEMQKRWVRDDWFLSSSNSTFITASETDAAVYIVQGNTTVADPVVSNAGLTFSTSRTQIAFYMECCRYRYMSRQLMETALTGIEFREMRGTLVNRISVPKNVQAALEIAEQDLIRALRAAQDQTYVETGEQVGGLVAAHHSQDYTDTFNWRA